MDVFGDEVVGGAGEIAGAEEGVGAAGAAEATEPRSQGFGGEGIVGVVVDVVEEELGSQSRAGTGQDHFKIANGFTDAGDFRVFARVSLSGLRRAARTFTCTADGVDQSSRDGPLYPTTLTVHCRDITVRTPAFSAYDPEPSIYPTSLLRPQSLRTTNGSSGISPLRIATGNHFALNRKSSFFFSTPKD